MVAHADLTGANLHEPKGAAAATSGQVYVADGAGSGSWSKPTAANTTVSDSAALFSDGNVEDVLADLGTHYKYVGGVLDDVSTAGFILIPIPEDCTVLRVTTVLHNAITAADATITVTRGGDSASLGNLTITQAGSAEGDVDELTPASNNAVTRATHKYIKVATDGGSTTTSPLFVQLKCSVTHDVY